MLGPVKTKLLAQVTWQQRRIVAHPQKVTARRLDPVAGGRVAEDLAYAACAGVDVVGQEPAGAGAAV